MAGQLAKILVPLLAGGYLAVWVWHEPGVPEDHLRVLTPLLLAAGAGIVPLVVLLGRDLRGLGAFNYLCGIAMMATLVPDALKYPLRPVEVKVAILWLIGEGLLVFCSGVALAGRRIPAAVLWGGWLFNVLVLGILAYLAFVFKILF